MNALVLLPQLTLAVDGAPLVAEVGRALSGVFVQQRLSLPALCELTFSDPPGPLSAASQWSPGAALRLWVDERQPLLFDGEITAVEEVYGPARQREVRVRAYDRLHRLRKQHSLRAHVQITVGALAQELMAPLGVAVAAAYPGPVWTRLIQHDRSDLHFLVDLAGEVGLYLTLRERVLHLLTLEGSDEAALALTLGEDLLEARFDRNNEPACCALHVAGWNALHIAAHQGRAGQQGSGEQANQEHNRMGRLLQDDDHARWLAQAELARRTAHERSFWGIAEGDPRLRPGTAVQIAGVERALTGRYTLTAVTHTIDHQRGFISELSTLPPALPAPGSSLAQAGQGVTLAVVSQVNDPQGLGRIRATLPGYGGLETDWMHVICIGAGQGKGLVALPDIGDTVLLLLVQGEAAAGVVLGGLFGMAGPFDSGVEGDAVRRYTLQTPGGQRVLLDDARQVLRLEDSAGSVVELSSQKVRIHAKRDLELEAPGRSIVIRGEKIDFQRG
jgi:phage baseplate assembly protein gpV